MVPSGWTLQHSQQGGLPTSVVYSSISRGVMGRQRSQRHVSLPLYGVSSLHAIPPRSLQNNLVFFVAAISQPRFSGAYSPRSQSMSARCPSSWRRRLASPTVPQLIESFFSSSLTLVVISASRLWQVRFEH